MDLFALCPYCELPVMSTISCEISCPYCETPLCPEDVTNDYFFEFFNDIKKKTYFDWDDTQELIYAVELLLAICSNTSLELARVIRDSESLRRRVEFYRDIHKLKKVSAPS